MGAWVSRSLPRSFPPTHSLGVAGPPSSPAPHPAFLAKSHQDVNRDTLMTTLRVVATSFLEAWRPY